MNHFNIRVYGLWIDDEKQLLVSDERTGTFQFTKFPGGGLEFGEGIKDCLIREWKEELDIDIEVLEHLYTTDFFQISAFDQTSQIISVYYFVKPVSNSRISINLKKHPFNFDSNHPMEIAFRKIPVTSLQIEDVTLPIDKVVVEMIIKLSSFRQGC